MKDKPSFCWTGSCLGRSFLEDRETGDKYSATLHTALTGDLPRKFLSQLSSWNDKGHDFKKLANIIQLNKKRLVGDNHADTSPI
jgi:hypothetical protein